MKEPFPFPQLKKQKLGTNASRAKGKSVTPLTSTQFALEQAVKRIVALEKQCDGLAKLDKQKDIDINFLRARLKRLEDRVTRRDRE
jgi:hypothetical protein